MNFFQSLYTDIGIHRKSNQDSIGLFKASTDRGEVLFALVCDGMGGYENGALASRILIETFENWFKCEFP
jgi:serine/threonine protein phosphatase PrpC